MERGESQGEGAGKKKRAGDESGKPGERRTTKLKRKWGSIRSEHKGNAIEETEGKG